MRYTVQALFDLVKTKQVNDEVIKEAIKSIYDDIDELNYASASSCYKALVIISYNFLLEGYIDDFITIGNILLSKELLDDQYDNVNYALTHVYFMMHYAPKVLEYSMNFIHSNCQKQNKELISIYNNLAVTLKESNFYDKALEYCDKCYSLIDKIDPVNQDLVRLITENNYCFILLKQNNFSEAIKHKKNMEQALIDFQDNPSVKLISTSIRLTILFVDLYTKENNDTINQYLQIMTELRNNASLGFGVKQSLEPHLEFITSLINKEMYQEAKDISLFLINCHFFTGDFTILYKLLIDTNELHESFLSEEELHNITSKYIKELEILDRNHKNILTVLIQEQYRLENLSKEYVEIRNKYQIDDLTNCYNRLYLEQNGQKYISSHKQGTVIFIDIDHFKSYNDNYGHHFGDIVLQRFAEKISKCTKPEVNFYRYAGDEFIIITPYKESNNTYLNSIIEEFNKSELILDKEIVISFSYGMVEYNKNNNNLHDLIEEADKNMYLMKNSKSN